MTDSPWLDASEEQKILLEIGAVVKKFQTFEVDRLLEITENAHGIFCDYAPINRKVISNLKRARGIVVEGVGYDNVDVQAATECGIIVSNNPNYMSFEVPDHVIGLMLSLARKIPWANHGSKS